MVQDKKKGTEDIMSQVLRMSDMVKYQAGSIVSRTLIDKPAGTVTLFAFAEGQSLSEHTSPYDAMVYTLDGTARITISGKDYDVSGGEMIIMPGGKPHALKATGQFKMALVMIKQ